MRLPDRYGKQPDLNDYHEQMTARLDAAKVSQAARQMAEDYCRAWDISINCRHVLALALHEQYERGFAHAVEGWPEADRERWFAERKEGAK
ncbi:MAG: SWIM zinc finger family protein [Rhodospirillaceae bacterium]